MLIYIQKTTVTIKYATTKISKSKPQQSMVQEEGGHYIENL